jgi:hypothetical protein
MSWEGIQNWTLETQILPLNIFGQFAWLKLVLARVIGMLKRDLDVI